MTISPELQARIDALEDSTLRASLLKSLEIPRRPGMSDEDIFEISVAGYQMAKEQQGHTMSRGYFLAETSSLVCAIPNH